MRYSVMLVDDPTGPYEGNLFGNIHGMCCKPEGASQR